VNLKYIGRPDSATPAVGSTKVHEKQAKALLLEIFPTLAVASRAAGTDASTEVDKEAASSSDTSEVTPDEASEPKGKRSGASRRTTAQKR